MANKLPDSGPISMLDVYNVLNSPMNPKDCDYYFETREDFDNRIDTIIEENSGDLITKTFGFSDNINNLDDYFSNKYDLISTPKMIIGNNITSVINLFSNSYYIEKISEDLFTYCKNIEDFSYCFESVYFKSIPENIFFNNKKAKNFTYCFSFCQITSIPECLFNNCPNVTNFNWCFNGCTYLITVPQNLFDNCRNVNDFSNCFNSCFETTSVLPDVWNKSKFPNVVDGTDYAYDCKKAANWNEIPSNFGGPSTNPPVTLSENIVKIKNYNLNTISTKTITKQIPKIIPTSPISLNDKDFRELAGILDGPISLRDFYGKSISIPLKLHIKFKYEKNGKLTFPYGAFLLFAVGILEEKNSSFNITGDEYIPNNDLITYSDNIFELYKINNQNTLDFGTGSSIELGETKNVLYIFIKNNKQELEKNSVKKIEGYIVVNDVEYKAGTKFIGYTKDNNLFCITTGNSELFLEQNVGKYIEINLQIEQVKADPDKHYYPFDYHNWKKSEVEQIITKYNGDLSKTTFEFFSITNIGNIFDHNQNIKSTPKKFISDSVTSVTDDIDSLFEGCKNLTYISPELFLECPNMIDFYSAFLETSISDIPQDLFKNCLKAENFRWCFQDCKNLTSIPQNLFSNCPNVNNFSYCFEGCSGITSAVPELWKTHPNAKGTGCFKGCINASNYNDIPSSWGGPA